MGFEAQQTINYETFVDEAIAKSEQRLKCISFNRAEEKSAKFTVDRDRDWNDLLAGARENGYYQPVEANRPLYLLYTSGRRLFLSSTKSEFVQVRPELPRRSFVRREGMPWLCNGRWNISTMFIKAKSGALQLISDGWDKQGPRRHFHSHWYRLGRWPFLRMLRSVAQWFDQCCVRRQTDWYAGCFVVLSSIFADEVMIVCGLIRALLVSDDIGCVAMFGIFWNLLCGMKSSEEIGGSKHRQLDLSLVDHLSHCL